MKKKKLSEISQKINAVASHLEGIDRFLQIALASLSLISILGFGTLFLADSGDSPEDVTPEFSMKNIETTADDRLILDASLVTDENLSRAWTCVDGYVNHAILAPQKGGYSIRTAIPIEANFIEFVAINKSTRSYVVSWDRFSGGFVPPIKEMHGEYACSG